MQYRVIGADRNTGQDVEIVLEAVDQATAERIAGRRNLLVASVEPVSADAPALGLAPEAPPQPAWPAVPPPAPQAAPSYYQDAAPAAELPPQAPPPYSPPTEAWPTRPSAPVRTGGFGGALIKPIIIGGVVLGLGIVAYLLIAKMGGRNKGADAPHKPPIGKPITLTVNLEKGQVYTFDMSMQQKINQKPGGQQQKIDHTMDVRFTYEVESVTPREACIILTYRRMRMKQSGAANMNADTDSPGSDPAAQMLSGMLNKPVKVYVDRTGEVLRVQGAQSLVQGMLAKTPSNMRAQMQQSLGNEFSDEGLKSMCENLSQMFPGRPVDNGDKWTKDYDVKMGSMQMRIAMAFKLLEHGSGKSIIGMTGKLAPGGNISQSVGGMSMQFRLKGEQRGRVEIEESSGVPLTMEMDQNFSGEVTASGGPIPGVQTWPIELAGTVTIKTTKGK